MKDRKKNIMQAHFISFHNRLNWPTWNKKHWHLLKGIRSRLPDIWDAFAHLRESCLTRVCELGFSAAFNRDGLGSEILSEQTSPLLSTCIWLGLVTKHMGF